MVIIETINTCNARCPFCPLFRGDFMMSREMRPARIMDQALFESLVDQIAVWPVKPGSIYLNLNGEPLQDPQIKDRFRYLYKKGLAPLAIVQTNGHFLTEDLAHALLDAQVGRVTIGFDGATRETYEQSRVRCSYDAVLDNIIRLARLRDAKGCETHIAIQYVRTRNNAHEVAAAYRMFSELLSPEKDEFYDTLSKNWSDGPADDLYVFRPNTATRRLGCQSVQTQLCVTSDGTLEACVWDYNLTVSDGGLGNANAADILAVWNGLKRRDLKARLSTAAMSDKPEKCRTCSSLYENDLLAVDDALIADKAVVSATPYGYIYRFPAVEAGWSGRRDCVDQLASQPL